MSKPSQKKQEKKKQREKQVRKQILARREAYRAQLRENKKFDKEEREASSKMQPITNADYYKAKALAEMEIKANLQANMELLKQLEEDYQKENPGKSLLEATEEALKQNEVVQKFQGKFQEASDSKCCGRMYAVDCVNKNN